MHNNMHNDTVRTNSSIACRVSRIEWLFVNELRNINYLHAVTRYVNFQRYTTFIGAARKFSFAGKCFSRPVAQPGSTAPAGSFVLIRMLFPD